MMISRIAACRQKYFLQTCQVLRSASTLDGDNKVPPVLVDTKKQGQDDPAINIQSLQGQQIHDFAPVWKRDVMNPAMEASISTPDRMNGAVDTHGHIGPQDYGTDTIGNGPTNNSHVDSYQHSSNVSLYSVMQSQVPYPYDHSSPTNLNMPSGGQSLNDKYISGMQNDAHPTHQLDKEGKPRKVSSVSESTTKTPSSPISRSYSTGATGGSEKLSQTARLKRAVKEYGSTVIVFHVSISLVSLGGFYLAVSSGLDVMALLQKIGIGESIVSSSVAAGASTFVLAYAVHKIFAPARIACTLTTTPFIVRYLRNKGILKPPKSKN